MDNRAAIVCLMKTLLIFFLLLPLTLKANNNTPNHTISNIESFEWDKRIILIHAIQMCEQTSQQLNLQINSINERHVLWFILCDEKKDKRVLSNYLGIISADFFGNIKKQYLLNKESNIILIGKDGGTKYRSKRLSLNELFNRIDSMPMRQSEMLEQQDLRKDEASST